MIIFVVIIVLVVALWLLKPAASETSKEIIIPKLAGLPNCSLDILNGEEVQSKIMRSARRCYSDGDNAAILADRIYKLLKHEKLEWPSYVKWSVFVAANRKDFHESFVQMLFPDGIELQCRTDSDYKFPPPEIDAYAATVLGYVCVEDKINRIKDAGFETVAWICGEGSCCSFCESLNGEIIPVNQFLNMCLIHPGASGWPGIVSEKNI